MAAAAPTLLSQLLPSLIGALGGGVGGLFSQGPTQMQGQQQELIDQLLASLGGDGPFSDLFQMDEDAFQKSYVDPAKSMFSNQIAPQIQQSFIQSGQQRGTGLEDTLTRAGVDMDQMLNQQYMQFQQQGQNNQMNTINKILGMGAGPQAEQNPFEKFFGGVAGFGTGESLPKLLELGFDKNRAGYAQTKGTP